jgi:hypothetical protein
MCINLIIVGSIMASLVCKFLVFEHGACWKGLCLIYSKYAEFLLVHDGGIVFCLQPGFLSPRCVAVLINDTCNIVVCDKCSQRPILDGSAEWSTIVGLSVQFKAVLAFFPT